MLNLNLSRFSKSRDGWEMRLRWMVRCASVQTPVVSMGRVRNVGDADSTSPDISEEDEALAGI